VTETGGFGRIGESAWRSVDKLFVEHARRMDAMQEHIAAHDEMNEIQNRRIDRIVDTAREERLHRDKLDATRDKRIDRLVERLDRAYTRIHALEKKLREMGGRENL
jgi:predicted RNase H-like nuclease (RuvC/YqgF family)